MSTPDLLSLILTLSPLPASPGAAPRLAPQWWARSAHALLLDVVRRANDVLAGELHDNPVGPPTGLLKQSPTAFNTIRPFTVSTLVGRFAGDQPIASERYSLRLTAFHPAVAEILLAAVQSGPLSPGQTVELDYLPFMIESAPPSPWSAETTYTELSAPYLLGKTPAPRRLSLQFISPTTFKSGGMHVPVPLPGLVFGSLLERWNAFAPVSFPPEVKRYAEECLAISHYRLSSRPVPMKSGGLRMGGVGDVTYTTINYDRYWMSVLAVLAQFALFSGVGAGVASGLGQCKAEEF